MSEWFYSKDGAQSGPVSDVELKALLANGTLDANAVLVWSAGMADWIPAARVPELAGTSAPAHDPYAAPASGFGIEPMDPGPGLTEIEPGSQPIDAVACFKRGLDLAVRHIGVVLLTTLVWLGISIGVSFFISIVETVINLAIGGAENSASIGTIAVSVVGMIINQVISIFLTLGFIRFMLNLVSGREATVGQLFGEGRRVIKAIVASIVFYLGILVVPAFLGAISALLFPVTGWWIFIPIGLIGLVAIAAYSARFGFFLNAIVDRNCGIIESLQYSSQITRGSRVSIVFLYILGMIAAVVGMIALCVGLLFTIPVSMIAMTVAFRWLQYGNRAAMDHPGTTTPMLAQVR
jgi:hypothetical protein